MEYPLTDADGVELVQLFNEVTDIAPRSLIHKDLYLHFRADDGWRCRFFSGDDAGPWAAAVSDPARCLARRGGADYQRLRDDDQRASSRPGREKEAVTLAKRCATMKEAPKTGAFSSGRLNG
jgi:hypothetical protein